MEKLNQTRRKFKVKLEKKQDTSDAIPGLLGKGDGTVVVPTQAGMVYYRAGNEESPGTAYNSRVPLIDNLPIFVGYDPITDPDRRLFQVLSIRQTAYTDAGNTPIPEVGPHHTTHEFGGGDDVYVEWRRIMGLRVGRPALFVVTVDTGYIYRAGTWILAPVGVDSVDLTAEQAALVGTQAQLILISLDSTGAVAQTNGAIVASPAMLTIANCPTPPAGNIPLAAVRIYATQTAIGDTPSAPDIIDLRFPTYDTMRSQAHNILSSTHLDSTAAACVLGDIITGQAGPVWARLAHGTQYQTLHAGATTPEWGAVNLAQATAITGILPVGNGGTGLAGGTSGGVPYYSGAATITSSAALTQYAVMLGGGAGNAPYTMASLGTATWVLTSNGAGAAPTWQATTGWSLTGNAGTVDGTNFIGSTDSVDVVIRSNNTERARFGVDGSGDTLVTFKSAVANKSTILQLTTTVCSWDILGGTGNGDLIFADATGGGYTNTAAFTRANNNLVLFTSLGAVPNTGATNPIQVYRAQDSACVNYISNANNHANANAGYYGIANAATNFTLAAYPAANAIGAHVKLSTASALYLSGSSITISNPAIFSDTVTVTTDKWIGMGAAKGRLTFTDAVTDMAVFSDCNVGIGTNPSYKFDVLVADAAIAQKLGSASGNLFTYPYYDSTYGTLVVADCGILSFSPAQVNFYNAGVHIGGTSAVAADALLVDGAFGCNGAAAQTRAAHIANPSGGATIDAEARTAINAILVVLENFGFAATS